MFVLLIKLKPIAVVFFEIVINIYLLKKLITRKHERKQERNEHPIIRRRKNISFQLAYDSVRTSHSL